MSEDSNLPPQQPAPQSDSPHLRARIPDRVAGGTFSTGAIVMTGPHEFVLDFLQTIGRPHRVACRVIIPHAVMPQFIAALRTNLDLYQNRFGPAPTPHAPANEGRRPTPQEIYDDLKLPDEILSGVYSNGVMIGHGANEFSLDFLTSFFPQSAVSARVYLASGQIPRLLDSLQNAVGQLQQRQSLSAPEEASPEPDLPSSSGDVEGGEEPPGDDSPPEPPPEPPNNGGSGGTWV